MIRTLRMVNFRCFEEISLEIAPEGGIYVGQNAQGKTSLLEAVCLLLRLQSPRARHVRQLAREGMEEFGIAGNAWGQELQLRGSGKGLTFRVEGEEMKSRRTYLSESGLVVWMGNSDLDLVRGGGESRRRYLDFIASQIDPEYRFHWVRYRKALALRNKSLKFHAASESSVKAFTNLLIEHGNEIIKRRQVLCEQLTPASTENHSQISGKEEPITITYHTRARQGLAEAFAEVEESETRRGLTLAGPHRDDLKLTIAGRPAREFGSEGQQRTLALALKLAQGDVLREKGGQNPIYLIDDIFGELDPARRNALMTRLPSECQKLITTTTVDWWKSEGGNLPVSRVENGQVL